MAKATSRGTRKSRLRLAAVLAAVAVGIVAALSGGAFASTGPSITTDQADYGPGSTVTLTGSGWQGDSSVALYVNGTRAIQATSASQSPPVRT
jgi:hypothetical protein